MGCGGSTYLSWCTPHGGGAHVRENECLNAAIFPRIHFTFTFALPPQTQGKRAVELGHFVGHRGTVGCAKGAFSFHGNPDFAFFSKNLKVLLPLQLRENSCCRSKSFIYAPIFTRFSLPIQKVLYRPFAKGTYKPLLPACRSLYTCLATIPCQILPHPRLEPSTFVSATLCTAARYLRGRDKHC